MFALGSIPPKHRIMYTLACICTLRSYVIFAGIGDSVLRLLNITTGSSSPETIQNNSFLLQHIQRNYIIMQDSRTNSADAGMPM